MTTQQPDSLDDLLHEYTITHMGNSHNAQCRCIGGSKSHLKYEINALMIPRKEVEAALDSEDNTPKLQAVTDYVDKLHSPLVNLKLKNPINYGAMQAAFESGYDQAISDIRKALGMETEQTG